ncbi:ABC transporter substrate-binding protein [Arthrobacter sp. GMC3]|uniref:ABC transporter substrate-binding protein n=1 Tax=Arthrobacter sp. GMC3 TaxID=2058894 RepID=UPI000CE4EEE6|nr:ABC transporter substrate-binding protein [Arthrobacter sp. GMC3]
MSSTLSATTAAPLRKRSLVAFALIAVLAISGCSLSTSDADSAPASQAESGAFPVTIKHALGETTIKQEPKRVLVMDSESADTTLALGIVPTSISKQTWGGDEQGYFPWTRQAMDKLVAETPQTKQFYSESGDLNFEVILGEAPDIILAPYSGFSQEDYQRLSEIAPTLPYDNKPWQPSSWQAMTTSIGQALGRPARAAGLVAGAEAAMDQAKTSHPEFQGVSFLYGTYLREGETEAAIYGPADPRVKFIEALGLTVAPDVIAGAGKAEADSFSFGVSLEKLDTVDADIFLGWASEQSEVDYSLKNPLFSRWPVITGGKDLWITDKALSSATQRVSVLGIPWGLDVLVPQLSAVIGQS